jgi:DNA-binding CsgD family transcriptional regulator
MDPQLENAPIGVITVRDGSIDEYNERVAEIAPSVAVHGEAITDVFPESVEGSLSDVFGGSSVSETSFEEYYPSIERWLSVSVEPDTSSVTVYISDVTDRVTQRKELSTLKSEYDRATVVDQLIADVLHGLVDAPSREAILETIRERLGKSDQYRFVWTAEHVVESEELIVDGVSGDQGNVFPAIQETIEEDGNTPEQLAIDEQQPQFIASLAKDDSVSERLRVAAFADGAQSVLALPLAYESRVYGVIGIYAETADAFSDHVRSSFETLGNLAGLAINARQNRKLLFADTITEVTFGLRSHSPLATLTERCGVSLTLDGTVPLDSESLTCYVTVAGGDVNTVVDEATGLQTVTTGRVVRQSDADGGRIELTLDESAPLVAALTGGANIRSASFEDGTGQVVVEVPPDANVRRLAVELGGDEPAPVLARQDTTESPTTTREFKNDLKERLTDRQATVLRTAYLAGYFESPRGSTAEEVATSLDITGSTLIHHLRRSQRKLLDVFYEEEHTD